MKKKITLSKFNIYIFQKRHGGGGVTISNTFAGKEAKKLNNIYNKNANINDFKLIYLLNFC